MIHATILQEQLTCFGTGSPNVELDSELCFSSKASCLFDALLHWRSECSNLSKADRLAIESLISKAFNNKTITPWEHFSISLTFPQLALSRHEEGSQLAETLPLNAEERLAAAFSMARIGLLHAAIRCLNRSLNDQPLAHDEWINVTSAFKSRDDDETNNRGADL